MHAKHTDMLRRKFAEYLERFLREEPEKILLINGARQVGKSFLVRETQESLILPALD